MADREKIANAALAQGSLLAAGGALGALTKHVATPRPGQRGGVALQIGSAVGAAAASGAGLSGSVGAGVAVVTAKVAAGAALATAAAPFVVGAAVVGGVVYGLNKLLK